LYKFQHTSCDPGPHNTPPVGVGGDTTPHTPLNLPLALATSAEQTTQRFYCLRYIKLKLAH